MHTKQTPSAELVTHLCRAALRAYAGGCPRIAKRHLESARAELDKLSDQNTLDSATRLVAAVGAQIQGPGALN